MDEAPPESGNEKHERVFQAGLLSGNLKRGRGAGRLHRKKPAITFGAG
jgi:hypothetical protein